MENFILLQFSFIILYEDWPSRLIRRSIMIFEPYTAGLYVSTPSLHNVTLKSALLGILIERKIKKEGFGIVLN